MKFSYCHSDKDWPKLRAVSMINKESSFFRLLISFYLPLATAWLSLPLLLIGVLLYRSGYDAQGFPKPLL
jgi:hypothetical protein